MMTHNFILHEEQRPVCIPCYSFTIEHALVDIIDFGVHSTEATL